VNYLLLAQGESIPGDLAAPVYRGSDYALYRLAGFRPRAAFSRAVAVCASSSDALSALESGADLSAVTLLEVPEGLRAPEFDPPLPEDSVDILEAVPMRTVLRTKTAGPRLLVLADSFESGWRCRLEDGSGVDIYPVNVAFRGVRVPPGDHEVTFSYEAPAFRRGAKISLFALGAVAVFGAWSLLLRKHGGAPRRPDQPPATDLPE
jgi:hypothetical protein